MEVLLRNGINYRDSGKKRPILFIRSRKRRINGISAGILRIIIVKSATVVPVFRFKGVGGTNGVKSHTGTHRVAAPVDHLYKDGINRIAGQRGTDVPVRGYAPDDQPA